MRYTSTIKHVGPSTSTFAAGVSLRSHVQWLLVQRWIGACIARQDRATAKLKSGRPSADCPKEMVSKIDAAKSPEATEWNAQKQPLPQQAMYNSESGPLDSNFTPPIPDSNQVL